MIRIGSRGLCCSTLSLCTGVVAFRVVSEGACWLWASLVQRSWVVPVAALVVVLNWVA